MEALRVLPPSETDADLARTASSKIIPFVREQGTKTVHLTFADGKESIVLPSGSLEMFNSILEAMAAGHGVMIFPQHAELTTMEAADILNVSRPYLIGLLNKKEIPFRLVGRHRRIRIEDVMKYKEDIDRRREAILDQMVAEAEELGLYD
ncbi:MAG: excisionase family DNA-binding protein [Anaerolineae bacterium]|nr:excisionase family DNA-binding protein [Anaerolineae bacterium]